MGSKHSKTSFGSRSGSGSIKGNTTSAFSHPDQPAYLSSYPEIPEAPIRTSSNNAVLTDTSSFPFAVETASSELHVQTEQIIEIVQEEGSHDSIEEPQNYNTPEPPPVPASSTSFEVLKSPTSHLITTPAPNQLDSNRNPPPSPPKQWNSPVTSKSNIKSNNSIPKRQQSAVPITVAPVPERRRDPYNPRLSTFAPPVYIDHGRSRSCNNSAYGNGRYSNNPADRLRNVDVVEELCYYVPGEPKQGQSFDYYQLNEYGELEFVAEGHTSPDEPTSNPVTYTKRQRFNFKQPPRHGDEDDDGPPFAWPYDLRACKCNCCTGGRGRDPNCCCDCCCKGRARRAYFYDEIPVGKNPDFKRDRFSSTDNMSATELIKNGKCDGIVPSSSGIYYFDADKKQFFLHEPEITVEAPLPPIPDLPPPIEYIEEYPEPVIQPIIIPPMNNNCCCCNNGNRNNCYGGGGGGNMGMGMNMNCGPGNNSNMCPMACPMPVMMMPGCSQAPPPQMPMPFPMQMPPFQVPPNRKKHKEKKKRRHPKQLPEPVPEEDEEEEITTVVDTVSYTDADILGGGEPAPRSRSSSPPRSPPLPPEPQSETTVDRETVRVELDYQAHQHHQHHHDHDVDDDSDESLWSDDSDEGRRKSRRSTVKGPGPTYDFSKVLASTTPAAVPTPATATTATTINYTAVPSTQNPFTTANSNATTTAGISDTTTTAVNTSAPSANPSANPSRVTALSPGKSGNTSEQQSAVIAVPPKQQVPGNSPTPSVQQPPSTNPTVTPIPSTNNPPSPNPTTPAVHSLANPNSPMSPVQNSQLSAGTQKQIENEASQIVPAPVSQSPPQ